MNIFSGIQSLSADDKLLKCIAAQRNEAKAHTKAQMKRIVVFIWKLSWKLKLDQKKLKLKKLTFKRRKHFSLNLFRGIRLNSSNIKPRIPERVSLKKKEINNKIK